MTSKPILLARLWLAACALALTPALAQSATVKPGAQAPAAQQATSGRTLSIGGSGSGSGPLLSLDELKSCLDRQGQIRTRLAELQSARSTLDTEKQTIAGDQQTLRKEREPVDALKAQAEDLASRLQAFAAHVQDWSARVKTFNEARGGEAQRDALNREREQIDAQREVLDAERNQTTSALQASVADYNAKAAELDTRVNDWNQRNGAWTATATTLETDRQDWVTGCADRRYREDDEKLLRKGQ